MNQEKNKNINMISQLHTENSLVQICNKTAIMAQINDEQYNGDAVLLKYCSNDGYLMLMCNKDK